MCEIYTTYISWLIIMVSLAVHTIWLSNESPIEIIWHISSQEPVRRTLNGRVITKVVLITTYWRPMKNIVTNWTKTRGPGCCWSFQYKRVTTRTVVDADTSISTHRDAEADLYVDSNHQHQRQLGSCPKRRSQWMQIGADKWMLIDKRSILVPPRCSGC